MGWGIYRDPAGRYAVFSSIVDDFLFYDATEDEARSFWREEFGRSGDHSFDRALSIANGETRHPLGNTFANRLEARHRHHGPEAEDEDFKAWLARCSEEVGILPCGCVPPCEGHHDDE